MSGIRPAVEDYLTLRRRLGFTLDKTGRLLEDFVGYLEQAGAAHITTELALAWATSPQGTHPQWWHQRMGIVRGFARYYQAIDPATEVPPAQLLPARRPRVSPYLYSGADLAALLAGARELAPPWRAATYETLVGLLAVTGLRLGEALGLDRPDADLAGGVLVVGRAKYGNPREVPLHESTVMALRRYARIRDRQWPRPQTASFFVAARGGRLGAGTVADNFRAPDHPRRPGRERRTALATPARPSSHPRGPDAGRLVPGRGRRRRQDAAAVHLPRAHPSRRHLLVSPGIPGTARPRRPATRNRSRPHPAGAVMSPVAPTLQAFFTDGWPASARPARTRSPLTATPPAAFGFARGADL